MSTIPDTIFKYEAFNVLSLQNLKAQSVYFASPRQFNDPYDCAITAGVTEPTDDELEKIKQYYLSLPGKPIETKAQLEHLTRDELRDMMMRMVTEMLVQFKTKFSKENGVSCFSERNDDLLMWSHYGGRYRGFCLEFRTHYEPFNKLRPVIYTENMPRIDILQFLIDRDATQLINLYCTKAREWAYEREWRGIHSQVGTLFCYESHALKAIYFGPDIERHALEIICLILGGQNPQVELWLGTRSEDRFKVDFKQTTYTSFLKAKELGLTS